MTDIGKDHHPQAISTYGDQYLKPGMLSSPQIAYCVEKYKIIAPYESSCLSSATYHMRIGGHVIIWEDGQKKEFTLGEQDDRNKNIRSTLTLKPNSLTFITTIEKFNLPKDIIARFNLKSKWVHRGLLLGTGPIVDPELKAHLLIPLHNFSSQNVTIKYGKEIISVEFTKTSDPDEKIPRTEDEDYPYIDNRNRIFDFFGYAERAGENVKSSVSSQFEDFQKKIDAQNKIYNTLKKYSIWGGLAFVLTFIIGLGALLYSTFSTINDANKYVSDATMLFRSNKDEFYPLRNIKKLETFIANAPLQRKDISLLQDQIKNLQLENDELKATIHTLKTQTTLIENSIKKRSNSQQQSKNSTDKKND